MKSDFLQQELKREMKKFQRERAKLEKEILKMERKALRETTSVFTRIQEKISAFLFKQTTQIETLKADLARLNEKNRENEFYLKFFQSA